MRFQGLQQAVGLREVDAKSTGIDERLGVLKSEQTPSPSRICGRYGRSRTACADFRLRGEV